MLKPKFKTPFAREVYDILCDFIETEVDKLGGHFAGRKGGSLEGALTKLAKTWEMQLSAVESAHNIDIREQLLETQIAINMHPGPGCPGDQTH